MPECGSTFTSKVYEEPTANPATVDSENVAISEDRVDQILGQRKGTRPKGPVSSKPAAASAPEVLDTFAIFGHVLFYLGAFFLSFGLWQLATVPNPHKLETDRIHNMPRADRKQSIILASVAMIISGAVFWSRSRKGPSIFDLMAVSVWLILLFVEIVFDVHTQND